MVPAMNHFLRCIAPVCIDEAQHFDQRVMEAAMDKLGLEEGERSERTTTLLQGKLRDGGGWGLTPAARTSPSAFLGSLATCHTEPTVNPYCGTTPLLPSSQLHGWIDDGLQRVRRAAPGDDYQAGIEPLLPTTASDVFTFYAAADSSVTTKLQRSLNAKANSHFIEAAVESMKANQDRARSGNGRTIKRSRRRVPGTGRLQHLRARHTYVSQMWSTRLLHASTSTCSLSLLAQWRHCRTTAHCARTVLRVSLLHSETIRGTGCPAIV